MTATQAKMSATSHDEEHTRVWALETMRLSRLLGCSEVDLLHSLTDSSRAGPMFANRRMPDAQHDEASLAWHSTLDYKPPDRPRAKVHRALISTVSSSSKLSEAIGKPKELLRVGQHPVIVQSLRQLLDAGVDEVVIVINGDKKGDAIASAIRASPVSRYLQLTFVEVAGDAAGGHGPSLLPARGFFLDGAPFLMCTSDHCFEAALIRKVAETELPEGVQGLVVAEYDPANMPPDVPSSAVRMRMGADGQVIEIARDLESHLPLEAGLFLMTPRIFDVCTVITESGEPYFTFAQALSHLVAEGVLRAVATDGLLWCAVETLDQLRGARHLADPTRDASRDAYLANYGARAETLGDAAAREGRPAEPLLNRTDSSSSTSSYAPTEARRGAFWPRMLYRRGSKNAIPHNNSLLHLPELPSGITNVTITQHAATAEEMAEERPEYTWEAQEVDDSRKTELEAGRRSSLRRPNLAPGPAQDVLLLEVEPAPKAIKSSISVEKEGGHADVHLRSAVPAGDARIKVSVERSVPLVGWVIIVVALLGMSSTALGFRVLGSEAGLLVRLSWRFCVAAVWLLPWATIRVIASRNVRRTLSKPFHWLLLCCAATGWWFHFGSFVVAMHMTSPAIALLFNNMTPLLLLAVRIVRRQPVQTSEVVGAFVGILGTVLLACAGEEPEEAESDGPPPSKAMSRLGSFIAMSGSIGGVMYILACKHLRPVMEPVVQFAFICSGAWALMIPVIMLGPAQAPFARTPDGVFGWTLLEKLPVALAAGFICEIAGNLGFVVALKYISPLTVAVLVLLGPLVAAIESMMCGEPSPSLLAWIGMCVTLVGTAIVIVGSSTSKTTVDVSLH